MAKLRIKDRADLSLSTSLKYVILGIVLVVAAAFTISTYFVTQRERRDYNIRESENVLKTLSSNISSDIEKYTSLSRLIMIESRVRKFLRAQEASVDIGMINDARYGIMDILNVTEGVDSVMIFREDMIMVATNRFTYDYDYDLMNSDSFRHDIYEGQGRAIVSLNSNGIATRQDKRPVVTIGRAINDIDSQKRTGLLMMNISTSVFEGMLKKLGGNNICIIGTDGTFLAGNSNYSGYFTRELLYKGISHKNITQNGERMLLSACPVEEMPIVILRVSPYGTKGIPVRTLFVLLFLLLVFAGLTLWEGVYVRKNITDPIFMLSASMEKNKRSGELKKINARMPFDEFEQLESNYNDLIDHVNKLFGELVEKEKNLQKAEMRVLQEQIKPHFLYNSIETIGFMALDAGATNVHDALETLGSFYRNFLSKGDREIPLSREVCIVKDYLSLQKLRYGDILHDEYEISQEAENVIVPKLILQPIVENSIYHGIRLKGEPGTIRITASILDEDLHLKIRDTGVGMEKEQIEKVLNKAKKSKYSDAQDSFGLWGAIERIRYYSGRDDVVRISSEIGEYTEIEFIIPVCD